jgi:putative RNA 2'-phosphotransferase
MPDLVRLSKFLAVMLRHEADEFGLSLDAEGFTDTDAVWEQINKRYPGKYTYADLLAVVAGDQDGKKRYEIQGWRIRALFGHSDVRRPA